MVYVVLSTDQVLREVRHVAKKVADDHGDLWLCNRSARVQDACAAVALLDFSDDSLGYDALRELLNHPLSAVRTATWEAVHKTGSSFLRDSVDMYLVREGETSPYLRALIARFTENTKVVEMLVSCPEDVVRAAVTSRGHRPPPGRPKIVGASPAQQWELLRAAQDKPAWGVPRQLSVSLGGRQVITTLFGQEAVADRLAALLDPRLPTPSGYDDAEVRAAVAGVTALVEDSRSKDRVSWPANAVSSAPTAPNVQMVLGQVVREFTMVWTETGNISREDHRHRGFRAALEPDVGVGDFTHAPAPDAEADNLVAGTIQKYGPLVRLVRRAGLAEAADRTGLTHVTITRGVKLSEREAANAGVVVGPQVGTLPLSATFLQQRSVASSSPAAVFNASWGNNGESVVTLVSHVPLEKFIGVTGVGFGDFPASGGEADCPVGQLPPESTMVVFSDSSHLAAHASAVSAVSQKLSADQMRKVILPLSRESRPGTVRAPVHRWA